MSHYASSQHTKNFMISFAKAQQIIIDNTPLNQTETIALDEACGRVLAENIFSHNEIPAFDNAAMDGYAVNCADLDQASEETPVILDIAGLTSAGDTIKDNTVKPQLTRGKAWKIMTGAPVPLGFDSIIPVENTSITTNNKQITCYSSTFFGAHIRRCGEDFKADVIIAPANCIINANIIMALAAHGISRLKVYKKISLSLFSTGRELVDNPEQSIKPGQIRNSNKPFIINWLKNLPVHISDAGTNNDDPIQFESDLQNELSKNTQIIISSGAVSMGDFDFIPETIKKLGGEILFHKIKMRPGKPLLFARFPNGSLYFGLPGNPISSVVGLRFFVSSAIRKLLGLSQEKPTSGIAVNSFEKKIGVRSILKASAHINSNTRLAVSILEGQESFKISPLLNANGWGVVDENTKQVTSGDKILFYPANMAWE